MPAQDLAKIANELRGDVLRMVVGAGAGHVAGPMSSAEILAVLYFGGVLKYEARDPYFPTRDRFVLSCGHYCPVLYATLARAGFFPAQELASFMQMGSKLPGHPEYRCAPGVEAAAGPLGQGISQAVGQALSLKLKYGEQPRVLTPRVYCLISDGETQEGQVWEAVNTAVRRQLDNLIIIVDRNRVQIENYGSQVVSGDLVAKLEGFGLHALEVAGNDGERLRAIFAKAQEVQGAPVVIVANTVAGRGVSFMENKPEWHDKVPTPDELKLALTELGEKNG